MGEQIMIFPHTIFISIIIIYIFYRHFDLSLTLKYEQLFYFLHYVLNTKCLILKPIIT